jgi:predicted TIM-barrel fold metal-dependent hydrolase
MPISAVVDFHNHFIDPSIALSARWKGVNERLTDARALVDSMESAGIDARVISAPPEFLLDEPQPALNDAIAALVNRHPGRLYGLATVNAYSGEAGARELTRAVKQLGLRGVFVESARDGLLPNAKEVRPTLAAAAELGVPVFLHPVPDAQLKSRFANCGRMSERLVRSTINSAAILAMIDSGTFEELPSLRVVVTALALGGLLFAPDTKAIYIDTTGFQPATIRCAVDLLGPDHVLMGTDWPVVVEKFVPERMAAILGAEEQRQVLGENALKLLRV